MLEEMMCASWILDAVTICAVTSMDVLGKGNVRLRVMALHMLQLVFFVPELKNNLLSIGQLQEREF